MVTLIILNIILIILLVFLLVYILRSKKNNLKNVYVNHDNENHDYINDNSVCEITLNKNKRKIKNKSDRVFEGRFVTDEEYQQMMKYKRSDVSILLEEVEREYEHLKELNK
jgi:isopentenyldiphosphate isomerase